MPPLTGVGIHSPPFIYCGPGPHRLAHRIVHPSEQFTIKRRVCQQRMQEVWWSNKKQFSLKTIHGRRVLWVQPKYLVFLIWKMDTHQATSCHVMLHLPEPPTLMVHWQAEQGREVFQVTWTYISSFSYHNWMKWHLAISVSLLWALLGWLRESLNQVNSGTESFCVDNGGPFGWHTLTSKIISSASPQPQAGYWVGRWIRHDPWPEGLTV